MYKMVYVQNVQLYACEILAICIFKSGVIVENPLYNHSSFTYPTGSTVLFF